MGSTSIGVGGLLFFSMGCGGSDEPNRHDNPCQDADSIADAGSGCGREGWRISSLDITAPDSLANVIVENSFNHGIDEFQLVWLIDLLRCPNSCSFRTGAGHPRPDDECSVLEFDTEPSGGDGSASCGRSVHIPMDGAIDRMDVVNPGGWALPFLPLREVVFDGLQGGFPEGDIAATITLEDAILTEIPTPLNETLCALISGDVGEQGFFDDDCMNLLACLDGSPPPDPDWECGIDDSPPDTDVGGAPAWLFSAHVEVVPATIE